MTGEPPQIDFERLSFPSDQLTIKAIRSVHPELFAQVEPEFFEGDAADVSGMLMIERQLAQRAFAGTFGRSERIDDAYQDRRELILMLADSYRLYGLSSGLKHTYELVRAFEKAASAQAQKIAKPGRS